MDELLELLYPEYALAQRCLKKMVQDMPTLPLSYEETGRFPREASEPHADEAIKGKGPTEELHVTTRCALAQTISASLLECSPGAPKHF